MARTTSIRQQQTFSFVFVVILSSSSSWAFQPNQLHRAPGNIRPSLPHFDRATTTTTTNNRNNNNYYYYDNQQQHVGTIFSTVQDNGETYDSNHCYKHNDVKISQSRLPFLKITQQFHQSLRSVVSRCTSVLQGYNRKMHKAVIGMIFVATLLSSSIAMAATSGGRIGGGSFKSAARARPSMSRSYSSSGGGTSSSPIRVRTTGPRQYSSRRPTILIPRIYQHQYHSPTPHVVIQQFSGPNSLRYAATASVVKDVLLLTGTGALIAYGLANNAYRNNNNNNYGDDEDTPYGPTAKGATLASVTVALDVAKKNDPNSILSRLRKIADSANTVTNRGLKDLVTAVTIELTRQEASISSATAKAKYYRSTGQAEREFRILSVKERSKVDRLTVNKFGSDDNPDDRVQNRNNNNDNDDASAPSKAVVTLNVALGGNFVGKKSLSKISSRTQLLDLLTQIGSDVQLEDNTILSAEIFWSPEDPTEEITQQELYSKYPELLPL